MNRTALVLGIGLSVAGCTAGPDYKPPEVPTVTQYAPGPQPGETVATEGAGGAAQQFVSRDVPAEWWALFENQALDGLVRQALHDNPKLAQMSARLVQARENLDVRAGATKHPRVDLGGSITTVGLAGGVGDNPLAQGVSSAFPLTLALASVNVSYTLDLAGRNRRELEGLGAAVDYEQFQLVGARLMLAGNIVTAAIQEASLREQIEKTEGILDVGARQLEILQRLETLGSVPHIDVVAQQRQLAETRAVLPGLRQRLDQTRHRLAIYLGQPPAGITLPAFRLADLHLPTALPLSLPSDLARQRPDIRAAEALLRTANARVGVAEANQYPHITLSGAAGAVAVSSLISGAGFGLLGASLAQPLFRGGQIKADIRAAVAAFDQAHATYHEVVLTGLQNVADVLVALDADAKTLHERREATGFAQTAYTITTQRYQAGGVSLLTLLGAERAHLSASLAEVPAIADRYTDSAALFQALGGGWWTAPQK